ncbi:MAG TPA: 3-phosphoshikimate 1-carboxyvinyltransferase [Steroidobacteraceae bacterium]|nr:3-phosphoshikimate 1-carboxyvinyltransferase [Steroidobacteraceae bacterium]
MNSASTRDDAGHSRQLAYSVQPVSAVRGTHTVPGDKSISHRALMLAGIAQGRTTVRGFLESEDCLATLGAMRALGVRVNRPAAQTVVVEGAGLHGLKGSAGPLDLGNSGTAMRLFTGLLAGQAFDCELIGDSSLMRRPMERVAGPLRQMGARIETSAGRPPVRISGGSVLRAIRYELPIASAQVKSALLLAGLYASGTTVLAEPAVTRDHSERMLQSFGVRLRVEARTLELEPPQQLRACDLEVPGDFSSAAFFIVAGCLAADGVLTLRNVGVNSSRIGLLQALRLMGAEIRVVNERSAGAEPVADLEIERRELRGAIIPPELVPLGIDEFPVLFVAAACARGETLVTGAGELRVKESDRIATMAEGLRTLGVRTEVLADGMRIEGGALGGGRIDSRGDHRIAMAFSVASVRAQQPIEIADVGNVATSFPGFVEVARGAGLDIQVHEV